MAMTRKEFLASAASAGALSACAGTRFWLPRKDSLRVVRYGGLCFTAETAGATITMGKYGSAPSVTLETSFTGNAPWTPFTVGSTTITLANVGDKVYFRAGEGGNTTFASSTSAYNMFALSGRVAASGNINSLLDRSFNDITTIPSNYCYSRLFRLCQTLTSAPELPSTVMKASCYEGMFIGCKSLINPPKLPATTLADKCYYALFYQSGLTSSPELPAKTLASNCYLQMFYQCTDLVVANKIHAERLANNCFECTFSICSSLTVAPELYATTLAPHCYNRMFDGCTGLTTAPVLKATTLTTYSYYAMFRGCTNLTDIYTKQNSFTGCDNWLHDHSGATFHCSPNLTIPTTRTISNVPPLWTVDPTYS